MDYLCKNVAAQALLALDTGRRIGYKVGMSDTDHEDLPAKEPDRIIEPDNAPVAPEYALDEIIDTEAEAAADAEEVTDLEPTPRTGHTNAGMKPTTEGRGTVRAKRLVGAGQTIEASAHLHVMGFSWKDIARIVGYKDARSAAATCYKSPKWNKLLEQGRKRRLRQLEFATLSRAEQLSRQNLNLNVAQSASATILGHVAKADGALIRVKADDAGDDASRTVLMQTMAAHGFLVAGGSPPDHADGESEAAEVESAIIEAIDAGNGAGLLGAALRPTGQ